MLPFPLSQQRGYIMTMCITVNENGNIHLMLVFPRTHMRNHFTWNGPPPCCGAANPSDWCSLLFFYCFYRTSRNIRVAAKNNQAYSRRSPLAQLSSAADYALILFSSQPLLKDVFPHVTPRNVQKGLCPFDRSIFNDEDIISGNGTDRPMMSTESDAFEDTENLPLPGSSPCYSFHLQRKVSGNAATFPQTWFEDDSRTPKKRDSAILTRSPEKNE